LNYIVLICSLVFSSIFLNAQSLHKEEPTFKVVPMISSNPTAGTGVGLMGSLTYQSDAESSPSQAIISAQYTDTDSYNLFLINKLFFDGDRWQSNSIYAHIYNKTTFSIDMPVYIPIDILQPHFDVKIDAILQQFMYLLDKNIYVGGQAFYVDQRFDATDEAGKLFLISNGIESVKRGGIGAIISYDTREKDEKFFPTEATFINLSFNYFPKFMGSDDIFYNALLNARQYMHGFSKGDVLAMQFLGQYCSENTPDGALSALGARNVLRGFAIGKYKARYLNALQFEYRYLIKNSRFRIAPFGGYANLSGGSKGTLSGNRDSNNGNYYSGGCGIHYILDKKHQLDYRIDVAYSSDDETSIYASLNQAF